MLKFTFLSLITKVLYSNFLFSVRVSLGKDGNITDVQKCCSLDNNGGKDVLRDSRN